MKRLLVMLCVGAMLVTGCGSGGVGGGGAGSIL